MDEEKTDELLHSYKAFWENVNHIIDIKNYHGSFNKKLDKIEKNNTTSLNDLKVGRKS